MRTGRKKFWKFMKKLKNKNSTDNVSLKWREILKLGGYEHVVSNIGCRKIKNFNRIWKKILRNVSLVKIGSVFEAGCGGGKNLAMFLANGWKCVGVDVSPEVVSRAENYLKTVREKCLARGNFKIIVGDFFNYHNKEKFDLVFQFGVLEHFLEESERLKFLRKMADMAKSDGYIISVVPSGIHPLREKMRQLKLGGYNIEEIDYNPDLMRQEMEMVGCFEEIKIIPHNIFGYFLINNSNKIKKILNKIFYYIFQIIPSNWMPQNFAFSHASVLIAIAKKN